MVEVSRLINPEMLVEIEADAVIGAKTVGAPRHRPARRSKSRPRR